MDRYTFAEILKSTRKAANLSVNDVCKSLKKQGIQISSKTVYGWENAYSQPNANTLMCLCKIYKITNVLETFGYTASSYEENFEITEFEKELLRRYREKKDMQNPIRTLLGLK